MNHIPLLSLLLGADTAPYDAPACFELAGRHFDWSIPGSGGSTLSFDGSTLTIDGKSRPCACIKCEEAVYLLKTDCDALLIRTDSSAAILAAGCAALHQTGTPVYDGALCGGWMDARFMPGRTIRFVFGSDIVSIDGIEFSASFARLSDSIYALCIPAGSDSLLLVINTARFLIYAAAETGPSFCGYANPR